MSPKTMAGLFCLLVLFISAFLIFARRAEERRAEVNSFSWSVKESLLAVKRIVYVRDDRTGLCFAMLWVSPLRAPGTASVSCSPEVMKLVVKQKGQKSE